ncbi:lipopolysaccharide biosynthesis protein [Arhodomonas sp. SL1]|uniref:lipopolysaccharide biosynthesis protein n=1 Tax=Arhodomonas sp. SL1 TaxID=3425691 RepID=UPI003F881D21
MREWLQQIWRSKFARSVAVVASGTAGAQAITMAFAPVITRLYGPEAYGLLGTFSAMVAMIAPVAALTYPVAIVLPKADADARALVKLALIVSAVIAALAFIVFAVAGESILRGLGAGEVAAFALLVPLVMLFTAWLQIARQWLIRQKAFKVTARVTVTQALLLNVSKTIGGLVYPVAAVLITVQTLGAALHAMLLGAAARRTGHKRSDDVEERAGDASPLALARRHKDFPLYRAPQDLINAASQGLPVLMLAGLFSPAAAGFYALARTVMGLPSNLVAQSVGTVFYPRIAEAKHNEESSYRLILYATLGLAAIGAIPFAFIVTFGPWLFGLVFGTEWVMAGEYARWLALMYFFNFINRPSVAAIPVLGRQRGLLIYELFSTGSKVAALYVGLVIYRKDELAVALFGIFGALAYISLIVWVLTLARQAEYRLRYAQQAG